MTTVVTLDEWELNVLTAYGIRKVPADRISETQGLTLEQVASVLNRYTGNDEVDGWEAAAIEYLNHRSPYHALDGWDHEVAKQVVTTARAGNPVAVRWQPELPKRQPQPVPEPPTSVEFGEPSTETLAAVAAGLRDSEEPNVTDDVEQPDVTADRIAATVDVLLTAEEHADEYVRGLAEAVREQLAALELAIADARERGFALADLAAYRAGLQPRIDVLRAELAVLTAAGTEDAVRAWADEREMWPHETRPIPAAMIYAYLKDRNGEE
jgi:hypothetical protein